MEKLITEIHLLCTQHKLIIVKSIILKNEFICHFENFKLITDFKTYAYLSNYDRYSYVKNNMIQLDFVNSINRIFILEKKNPDNLIKIIVNEINKLYNLPKSINLDPFNIYYKIDVFTKNNIDYNYLYLLFIKNYNISKAIYNSKIPLSLLLNPSQISSLLVTEIKRVNSNKKYEHYIKIDVNNPFDINIILILTDKKIELEFKLIINPETYPYMPPKFELIRPEISPELHLGLLNLNIFQINNWVNIITLDYIIENIGILLNPIIENNLLQNNKLDNILHKNIITLAYLIKDESIVKINLEINIPKKEIINHDTIWKAGTGYSTDISTNWNITEFIIEKELANDKITTCLDLILDILINQTSLSINKILINYINKQINTVNILELENTKKLYNSIFNISGFIYKLNPTELIISENLIKLYDDLLNILEIQKENTILINIFDIIKIITINYEHKHNKEEIKNHENNINKYVDIMKQLQFDNNYIIPKDHKFYDKITQKIESSTLVRILAELSSFKSNLPLNWDTTIWCRVSKQNYNIFTFIISGPKDTPYENGLFEFHIYLPSNYPTISPHVLLYNTNNFRFNPNLYKCGKVCLSLLGTWQGHESEKWNPKSSTILQIMISIQSLIFINEPYFNEPSYETQQNTPFGINQSNKYNNDIYPNTVKIAMINVLKNPPLGFENIVKNHFILKKTEILEKIKIWNVDITLIEELNKLIDELD